MWKGPLYSHFRGLEDLWSAVGRGTCKVVPRCRALVDRRRRSCRGHRGGMRGLHQRGPPRSGLGDAHRQRPVGLPDGRARRTGAPEGYPATRPAPGSSAPRFPRKSVSISSPAPSLGMRSASEAKLSPADVTDLIQGILRRSASGRKTQQHRSSRAESGRGDAGGRFRADEDTDPDGETLKCSCGPPYVCMRLRRLPQSAPPASEVDWLGASPCGVWRASTRGARRWTRRPACRPRSREAGIGPPRAGRSRRADLRRSPPQPEG